MSIDLESFLRIKGQEYMPFDPHRARRVFEIFKKDFLQTFTPKVIHIVGTNGKGSTGRFIALGLREYKVLHFTSPHLFSFDERFYCNGENIAKEALENAHLALVQKPYMQETSYFEYATFLALYLAREFDYLILEAGLGGEFDSTNVIGDKISVFAQIGFDHCEILGERIEQIAETKLNSMGKVAFLGIQNHCEVQEIARRIAQKKGTHLIELKRYSSFENLPLFLSQNFALAQRVLEFLGVCLQTPPILDLKGRGQKIKENIWLDVGHNIDGARAILRELEGEEVVLVYNSYKQKDIDAILACLKTIIKRVEIIEIKDQRIIEKERLQEILRELEIVFCDFVEFKEGEKYLVFGSFSVAREILRSLGEE